MKVPLEIMIAELAMAYAVYWDDFVYERLTEEEE